MCWRVAVLATTTSTLPRSLWEVVRLCGVAARPAGVFAAVPRAHFRRNHLALFVRVDQCFSASALLIRPSTYDGASLSRPTRFSSFSLALCCSVSSTTCALTERRLADGRSRAVQWARGV
uniref:Secreted protein n=1 Tax=Plectus sambesii TaxID=2011161 RepID=A0A914VLY4_9BILA